jgi:hypothetical protein
MLMIKIVFKKKFKFMLTFFRSTFLFLRVFFASFYLTSFLEFRASRLNDALEFWLFRKLMSSRAIDTQWWTTTTTKNRMWKTTIVRIVFDVVVYQLIVVVSRVSFAINVLNKRSRVFRYVVNSCVVDFLFNFRKSRFVFVSSFINCQTLVSFYASIQYHWKHLWKNERF